MDSIDIMINIVRFIISFLIILFIFNLNKRLNAAISFIKWVKSRHDTTHLDLLYKLLDYYIKREDFENAAKVKKIIDQDLEDLNKSDNFKL